MSFRFGSSASPASFPPRRANSFLVANAAYVAKMTGSAAAEVVLIRAAADPARLHDRVAVSVKDIPGAKVRDITKRGSSSDRA